jgi:hypothetical protein
LNLSKNYAEFLRDFVRGTGPRGPFAVEIYLHIPSKHRTKVILYSHIPRRRACSILKAIGFENIVTTPTYYSSTVWCKENETIQTDRPQSVFYSKVLLNPQKPPELDNNSVDNR